MAGIPIHPQLVHLPLALAIILPFFAAVVVLLIRKYKLSAIAWTLVAGLQVIATIAGYAALKTGEDDEHIVRETISRSIIHEHEERAEMFVAFSVVAMALAVAAIIVKPTVQHYLMIATIVAMLGQLALAFRTGSSGGELVYIHRAANAHRLSPANEPSEETIVPVQSNQPQDDHDYAKDETTEGDEDRENDSETDD